MAKGKESARIAHISFNVPALGLFTWQIPTGVGDHAEGHREHQVPVVIAGRRSPNRVCVSRAVPSLHHGAVCSGRRQHHLQRNFIKHARGRISATLYHRQWSHLAELVHLDGECLDRRRRPRVRAVGVVEAEFVWMDSSEHCAARLHLRRSLRAAALNLRYCFDSLRKSVNSSDELNRQPDFLAAAVSCCDRLGLAEAAGASARRIPATLAFPRDSAAS